MRQRRVERPLQVGAATQAGITDECQRLLHGGGIGGDGGRRKHRCFGVEQDDVEPVAGTERAQHAFERLETAIELLPLHRQRGIEQCDDAARCGRSLCRSADAAADERGRVKEARFGGARPRRRFRGRRRARFRIAIRQHFEPVGPR